MQIDTLTEMARRARSPYGLCTMTNTASSRRYDVYISCINGKVTVDRSFATPQTAQSYLRCSWLTHDPADDEKKNRAENILIAFQRTALYGICVQRPSKLVIMKRIELLKHVTESNRDKAIVLRAYLSDIETQSTHRDQTALVISPSNPFSMCIRNLMHIEKGFKQCIMDYTHITAKCRLSFFYQDNPKPML